MKCFGFQNQIHQKREKTHQKEMSEFVAERNISGEIEQISRSFIIRQENYADENQKINDSDKFNSG